MVSTGALNKLTAPARAWAGHCPSCGCPRSAVSRAAWSYFSTCGGGKANPVTEARGGLREGQEPD